eukprot:Skav208070  [mRNA]  locus=scaffold2107:17137:23642:- [translate_table: standard]
MKFIRWGHLRSTTVANRSAGEQLASQLEVRLQGQNYALESTHLEDIRSFFWWDGALQDGAQWRMTTVACVYPCICARVVWLCSLASAQVPFAVLLEGLSADHPYDLPMIVSSAHLDSKAAWGHCACSHKHAMALATVNGTTVEVAHGLAKSIVEAGGVTARMGQARRGVDSGEVAKLKADSDNEFTIILKTLRAAKDCSSALPRQEQIEIEFGGLNWEWHPIQANEKYLKWLEENVAVRPHAR